MNLAKIAAEAADREGVIWTLRESDDLNANLVHFPAGEGVGEHVNDEVDVVILGVTGLGVVAVDGWEQELRAATLAFIPKGARRSTRSSSDGFSYLTFHRRRGPVPLDSQARSEERRQA